MMPADAHVVEILGAEEVADRVFGRVFGDRAPHVSITTGTLTTLPRIGETVAVTLSATDDVGIASLNLAVNRVPVALDAENSATITLSEAGAFSLIATAQDTRG